MGNCCDFMMDEHLPLRPINEEKVPYPQKYKKHRQYYPRTFQLFPTMIV